jgi:hypothetical protein
VLFGEVWPEAMPHTAIVVYGAIFVLGASDVGETALQG